MKMPHWCPPRLLINIAVVWLVVTSLLYLLWPITHDLPPWASTLIEVPIAVSVVQFWLGPAAMKLRKRCDRSGAASTGMSSSCHVADEQ